VLNLNENRNQSFWNLVSDLLLVVVTSLIHSFWTTNYTRKLVTLEIYFNFTLRCRLKARKSHHVTGLFHRKLNSVCFRLFTTVIYWARMS